MAEQGSYTHTIDGKAESSAESFEVVNPATGEAFARCPDASREQLERAVASSRKAFGPWSRLSFAQRRKAIVDFAHGLAARIDEIGPVLTKEQGKPLGQAKWEIGGAVHELEAMSQMELPTQILRNDGKHRVELVYHPLGVVAAIAPWNFPIILAAHKIAHGLYAGNTMVLKPSPYTPLATLLMGEVARDTLPPGVLNTLAGGNALGGWMTEHPGIDRVSFTGSVATGKKVMASASGTLKRVTLELGGNDPAIVLDDANIDEITPNLFRGAFLNAGQICMAVKRIYAPDKLYEPLVEGLTKLARAHRVGDGMDPESEMGPLQNKMQFDKVMDVIEATRRDKRARITTGGHQLNRPGYFIAPTVVADAEDDMRIVQEEQFGPVVPVLRYSDLDDVVRRANDTRFGLAASVWTNDTEYGAEIAKRIEAGTVWINHHVGSEADMPFGGFKESGVGREIGALGLASYMEPQVIKVPLKA
ncbi:MAG TPA: aldehyde dehydrogenase family protein [Rhizomicrobium sp.]